MNWKVITVFGCICHYGPVCLLLCMTTSKTRTSLNVKSQGTEKKLMFPPKGLMISKISDVSIYCPLQVCKHFQFCCVRYKAVVGRRWRLKPWLLHLRFSTRNGNSTSSKLLCDRSRRWLQVQPGVSNVCNILQKVQLDEYSATLSQRFYCRTRPWLHVQHSDLTIPAT